MEAPGKVYLNGTPYYTEGIPFERDYHIEYVCTDAFIEKAATWFANKYQANGLCLCANDIEDFVKYMKGE